MQRYDSRYRRRDSPSLSPRRYSDRGTDRRREYSPSRSPRRRYEEDRRRGYEDRRRRYEEDRREDRRRGNEDWRRTDRRRNLPSISPPPSRHRRELPSLSPVPSRQSSGQVPQVVESHQSAEAPQVAFDGAVTVKELLISLKSVDPIRDALAPAVPNPSVLCAETMIKYRFYGPNHSDPKAMVTKDNKINEYRICREYNEIVNKAPAAIRWAREHGKLNTAKIDPRLLNEVMTWPHRTEAVKKHVKKLLFEMAERIQNGDDDDDDDSVGN